MQRMRKVENAITKPIVLDPSTNCQPERILLDWSDSHKIEKIC